MTSPSHTGIERTLKERAPDLVAVNRLVTAAIDYGVFCERHGDMSEKAMEAMRAMNDERQRVLAALHGGEQTSGERERLAELCHARIAVLLEEAGRIRQYGLPNYSRTYSDAYVADLLVAVADWRKIAAILRAPADQPTEEQR